MVAIYCCELILDIVVDMCYFIDLTISGTVTIQDGSLIVDDFVDTMYNVSSARLLDFGIPLDASVIDKHFTFHTGFEVEKTFNDFISLAKIKLMV